jgi:hypothetical protein
MTIPYRNLEAAIRKAMAKPAGAIYSLEAAALASLRADDRFISNLAGLKHCIELEQISLCPNTISDISPLPTCPRANTQILGSELPAYAPRGHLARILS